MSDPSFTLEQAHKQFSLETERLEQAYSHLSREFQKIQHILQDYRLSLAGRLTELNFMTGYLGTILNEISQGLLFIDTHGIVTTYNLAAQRLLQYPEKELLFHPFTKFFTDHSLGFSLNQAFHTKKCPSKQFIQWKQQEKVLELEVEATFVHMTPQINQLNMSQTNYPPIQGLLVLLRDLTEIRQLQQMANRQSRLTELGELAAHLAHEIRNPLGGIKGFASLLEQDLQSQPELKQMASAIMQGADELNQFVSRVLHYTRPFQLQLETVNISQLLQEIRHLMQVDSKWNPAIQFIIDCPELLIPIDPHLFKSALLNLFVNATQAMPEKGTLKVQVITDEQKAVFTIQDTGCGIASEDLSKIFSPFFTTKPTGNGLGLSEVHQVIQAHQGWIKVDSELGQGTTFVIQIPLTIGEA